MLIVATRRQRVLRWCFEFITVMVEDLGRIGSMIVTIIEHQAGTSALEILPRMLQSLSTVEGDE